MCLSVCPRGVPHLARWGERVPQSGPARGVPGSGPDGGVPWSGPDGGYPSQVWQGGTLAEVPSSRDGVPPSQVWWGYPGQVQGGYLRWGTPRLGRGTPGRGYPPMGVSPVTGQQMEYSIYRGRYSSCIHAIGLSCVFLCLLHSGRNCNHRSGSRTIFVIPLLPLLINLLFLHISPFFHH